MESAFHVLLIVGKQDNPLFEQIILHTVDHAVVTAVHDRSELDLYFATTVPACIIVDWSTEVIVPDLFPRQVGRESCLSDTYLIALVYQVDQLYSAYRVGYNFAITIEYTRATYYAVSTIIGLIVKNWRERLHSQLLQQQSDHLRAIASHWISVIEQIIYARIPEAPLVAPFARHCSQWIAERLTALSPAYAIDVEQLDLAARIYAIGRLPLSDADLNRLTHHDDNPITLPLASLPDNTAKLLEPLIEYPESRLYLATMYENYDGSGFPHRLQGWHIPLGARILRVAIDYAELVFRDGMSATEAISILQQQSRRIYDQRVVALLDEYITTSVPDFTISAIIPLRVENLSAGMTIGRDIITVSGLKLAAAGTTLSASQVERIISHHSTDPVLGAVYVLRQ